MDFYKRTDFIIRSVTFIRLGKKTEKLKMNELKPGRELDALVADKVLGWHYSKSSFEQYEPSSWRDKDGEEVWSGPFKPSEDIAAAWEVLSIFDYYTITQAKIDNEPVSVEVERMAGNFYRAEASTTPLAICFAALKAFGVEVG